MDGSTSSFWDNGRVGKSYTTDGDTWSRIDCGDGISIQELLLGNGTDVPFDGAGPTVDIEHDVIMQCSPRTDKWKQYASKPKGWSDTAWCPEEEIFADYETYNDYNYDKLTSYLSMLDDDDNDCPTTMDITFFTNHTMEEFHKCVGLSYLAGDPQAVMCGVPSSKFDEIYIKAQTYKNYPPQRLEYARTDTEIKMAGARQAFSAGNRETSIQSWHGIDFYEFGQHMVFYANPNDAQSVQDAMQYASELYQLSQRNGATGIRIPVVIMDTDQLFLQENEDDDDPLMPFTCPSTTITATNMSAAATTTTSSSSSAATASSFSLIDSFVTALLSSVFTIAASTVLYN